MEYTDLMQFLEKENLFDYVKDNSFYFQNIIKNCLGTTEGDILIISDLGKNNCRASILTAASYYNAAKRLGLTPKLVLQDIKMKGERAGQEVIDALANLDHKTTIIIATSGYLGSTHEVTKAFRKFCKKFKHKFVSTTGLLELPTRKFTRLIECMNIDYKEMKKRAKTIKNVLNNGKTLRIQTMAGTDVVAGIEGMKAVMNIGLYLKPGQGGNLPAGEVYIPPEPGTVNGKVVIDGSLRHNKGTALLKKPVTFTIENGTVVDIEETPQSKNLINTLEEAEKRAKYPENVRKVSEFGFGINPRASIIGPNLINEKTLGTAHIALGSNAWFGGTIYSIIHLDQVFRKPKIIVDDKLLII
ncbi:aminopeptidase [Candidatus Woesearchaeota archaeon]|nr:aminopeptidase [Candidatus Woesearchaeota archaeon]